MKYFTKEELQPSNKTRSLIRRISYSYESAQDKNRKKHNRVCYHNECNDMV